jgi:hypothetical protein
MLIDNQISYINDITSLVNARKSGISVHQSQY